MSELIERNLILCLVDLQAIVALSKNKIKADDFVFHREKLEFVLNYVKQYNAAPSVNVLSSKFDDLDSTVDRQSIDYYIDQLKKSALERKITTVIEKDLSTIRTDPEKALLNFSDAFSKLLGSTEQDVSHTDRDARKRLQWYEDKKSVRASGLIGGIPTGFKYFNDKREGFQLGNLVTIVGISWIGKSWILLNIGIKAYLAGYRVLTVSCEMTKEEQELRFDTLMGNAKGYNFNFQDLRNGGGDLSGDYGKYLMELSDTDNWITIDASDIENLDASEIAPFVDSYKPDVLLIDGMEMLQDKMGKNRQGWEEAKLIIRQAKMLANSRNILVVATAQAGRQASDRMPRAKDVAYSFDVYRASDYMIALARDQESDDEDEFTDNNIRYYSIQKERNGTGHIKRMKLKFDPANGIIQDIE